MSTIKSELLQLVHQVGAATDLPPVSQIYIPEPNPAQSHTEFGVIMLADGSAGLYYAWLGESQQGMKMKFHEHNFIGKSPLKLANLYKSLDAADCSIGLAAINAITQHIFHLTGFKLKAAGNSMGALEFMPDDHIGMVGYFPSLVTKLRQREIRLTVIEKKSKFLESGNLVNVTTEPARLGSCNKVIVTAATLLNETIDAILDHASGAEQIVVIGPTAGFFPDPLFSRRVTAIGGSEIILPEVLIDRLKHDEGMGGSASKYLIKKDKYPGAVKLLNNFEGLIRHR
ncbi:MAG: DUF364 protein [Gammaproteobacteria bacterium]|nr:DUF364 protein [Gammaproteobacteria bacterium]